MKNESRRPFLRSNLHPDPITQFIQWLREAEQADTPFPNAMTLATSNRQGKPSARIVLLKEVDERGFAFFTNCESRKARELRENPNASLVFWWLPLARQVRVEGRVERVDVAESDLYFARRPRGGQLGAHASPQSEVIEDRSILEKRFDEATRKFDGQSVPRPLHWGGYRVVPEILELWQEGENRLHDRLRYRRDGAGDWVIDRLAP